MRKNIVFINAYLIKKSDGFIVGKLNLTNDYETALSCDVYSAIAWDGQTLEPTEYDFAFHAGIKWDGCSHFNFYGQDYVDNDSEKDSYYHLCGVDNYYSMFSLMLFAKECAKYYMNQENPYNFDEDRYGGIPDIDLFEFYDIKYVV